MRIQFWGTRGSIAKSNAQVLRYGGHTSCVELRSEANDLLILDAGTGLHGLSQQLIREERPLRSASILISHTHWDHIQGLPFFVPFFIPNVEWNIYGPSTLTQDLESILGGQMQRTYFPITQDIFNAKINYHNLTEGELTIGDIHVKTHYLNHPGVTMGYRITIDGHTVVYSTDHEPHDCRLAHGGEAVKGSEDELHARFLEGADYVIHDTQYLADEYERYRGWGHSTMEYVVDLAHQADVRRLILFHHDPMRSDEEVDHIVSMSRERALRKAGKMDIWAASERQPLWVPPQLIVPVTGLISPSGHELSSEPTERSSIMTSLSQEAESVLCVGLDEAQDAGVKLAGHTPLHARSAEEGAELMAQRSPRLIFIRASQLDELKGHYQALFGSGGQVSHKEVKVVLFCQADECTAPELSALSPQPIRMVTPISDIYLSSRVETWLRRMGSAERAQEAAAVQVSAEPSSRSSAWERAPIHADEQARLESVERAHAALEDPRRSKRVHDLCQLLWHGLMIPSRQMSLISVNLIHLDQQVTMLTLPSPAEPDEVQVSCSRDASICAHVVAQGTSISTTLLSPDGLLKSYADYTSSAINETIRGYFGRPLYLNGRCVGTLCCYSLVELNLLPEHQRLIESTSELIEAALRGD